MCLWDITEHSVVDRVGGVVETPRLESKVVQTSLPARIFQGIGLFRVLLGEKESLANRSFQIGEMCL